MSSRHIDETRKHPPRQSHTQIKHNAYNNLRFADAWSWTRPVKEGLARQPATWHILTVNTSQIWDWVSECIAFRHSKLTNRKELVVAQASDMLSQLGFESLHALLPLSIGVGGGVRAFALGGSGARHCCSCFPLTDDTCFVQQHSSALSVEPA